jgi:hypothetical protein
MTIYEFETKYATEWVDQYGTKLSFMPLSMGKMTGAMFTTPKDGTMIGGEYSLREESGQLYVGWYGKEFVFSPTHNGFQLLSGGSIRYTFTAAV